MAFLMRFRLPAPALPAEKHPRILPSPSKTFAQTVQKALPCLRRRAMPSADNADTGRKARHTMLNPISIGLLVTLLISSIVGFSLLFKRAGLTWWHTLIPIYNDYQWMKATWTTGAFVRRMIGMVAFAISAYAMHTMGGITLDSEKLSFSFVTPFTLEQSIAGLAMCVSLIWVVLMQLEANWYAADAFDGTLGTFLGLSFFGGFAYLWMGILAWKGKRAYLGTLDERIEAEEEALSYAS